MPLADEFDGFLVDLDGVVWIGREPVPGSVEALQALLGTGKRVVFVTNNPGRQPQAYAERLRELGVEVGPEQIVTAGVVVARLAGEAAAAAGGTAFVIGASALKEMVAATGARLLEGTDAQAADAVVVSGHRGFDYEELLTAKFALDRGARLFATSHDPTMPFPGGELPGTGAVLAAVEVASGRKATIAGKPERHLFDMAVEAIRG
jgi:glycerol 3-phosphatase-2